jgi:hypothetical protein
MTQQTAVEWLEEQLNKWSDGRFYLPPHLFEQAEQMEKEQRKKTGEYNIEMLAWENPCLSRRDVYELFNDVFKGRKLDGCFSISASKQVYEFNTKLRELAKQKYLENKAKYKSPDTTLPPPHKTNNMEQQTIKMCTGCGRLNTQPLGLNENGEPYLACCPDNSYKPVTALEWFFNQLSEKTQANNEKEYYQAKQMEKEQIVEAFYEGMKTNPFDPNRGRGTMYYKETFGGQGSPYTSPNTQNK